MKKYIALHLFVFCFIYCIGQQNVGIGTTMPNGSSILDITSTTKGILIPRMSTAERGAIATPATGLLVFDNTTQSFWYRSNTGWINLQTSRMLSDADGDTKIQVEEIADEDVIRMDVAGAEVVVLKKNSNGDMMIEPGGIENNIFIGKGVGNGNSSIYNTAVGDSSLRTNSTGNRNTAMGFKALYGNIGGDHNTSTGFFSLFSNTHGVNNTASGSQALFKNLDGDNNSSIGFQSLYNNTTGSRNTAHGYQSSYNNTTAFSNVSVGVRALYRNTIRNNLVAIGDSALFNNGLGAIFSYEGSNNTAVGSKALFSNTLGGSNTANGSQALYSNVDGPFNSAFGALSLFSNTIGISNTAIGYTALYTNIDGNRNSALGYRSLHNNSNGGSNTASGYNAMQLNTNGNFNTAQGVFALNSNTTGDQNTAIGASAGFDLGTLNNTSCFGNTSGGVVDASNRVEIGNTSVSTIAGQVSFTTYSDARIKDNVIEDVPGISFINKLRPVTYNLNIHRQNAMVYSTADKLDAEWDGKYDIEKMKISGFIAQEVEIAAKELGFDFSGVDAPANPQDLYGLRYSEFVVPLVKAVQELSEKNTAQEATNEKLKSENEQLIARIERLEALLDLKK